MAHELGNVDNPCDCLIVGAGFAGLVAARELSRHFRVLVLEARDRIGGRTWTDVRMGRPLDLGGTWVHWLQPHTWAELTRYGIAIEPSPTAEHIYWRAGGDVHVMSPHEYAAFVIRGQEFMLGEAARYFPQPFQPLTSPDLGDIDHLSIAQRLAQSDLTGEELALHMGIWADHLNAPPQIGAYASALRWGAGAGNWRRVDDVASSFRLQGGTRALMDAVAEDIDAEIHLATPVSRVTTHAATATVHTANRTLHARHVIMTPGLNALRSIAFEPCLPRAVQHAIDQGSASRGLKTWIKVRGRVAPFSVHGGKDEALTSVSAEYFDTDATFLVAFGPRADRLDPNDRAAVSAALHRFRPDLEVLEVAGHDWVGDPWSGETWPVLQPGQLTGCLADLQKPFGRIRLAGSDVASGWAGFIDGAIESGLTAARAIRAQLHDHS